MQYWLSIWALEASGANWASRCNRSTGDGAVELPCERCTRAKTPCVVGRRRPAKKRQPSVSVTKTSMPTAARTNASTADAGQHFEAYTHSQSSFPTQSQLLTSTSSTIPSASSAQTWESESDIWGLQDVADIHTVQENCTSDWDSMPQDMEFSFNGISMFDADLRDPSSWLHAPFLRDQSTDTSTDTATVMNTKSSADPEQRLILLITNMQQCLHSLEHGPWQDNSTNTLDDYPVGTVLHLSQELVSIAASVLSRDCIVGTMTRRKFASAIENPAGGGAPTTENKVINVGSNNTAAPLLVLSGYMSLMRIYSIVIGHLETHIRSASSNSNADHGSGLCSPTTNPTLQLGQLPCTDVEPVLGKIHTALRMLLTAMHGVEEKVGPGGAVARNLVVALLAQEAVLDNGDLHGVVLKKMQSVKELVQDKMKM